MLWMAEQKITPSAASDLFDGPSNPVKAIAQAKSSGTFFPLPANSNQPTRQIPELVVSIERAGALRSTQ